MTTHPARPYTIGYLASSMEEENGRSRELRSPGTANIWLCQMGRLTLDGSFKEFIEKVLALPVKFDEKQVELTSLRGDHLHLGWEGSLLLNGEPLSLDNFKHYDNPYCTCELETPIMEIQHGADILRLHFEDGA